MIEMLGVLAIIGVLSAGGIMGYSTAMENYKVNQTIEDIRNMVVNSANLISSSLPAQEKTISNSKLYYLGIIPDKYYSTASASCIANINEVCFMKSLFGQSFNVYMKQFSEAIVGTSDRGSLLYIDLYNVPFSACIKIASYDWRNNLKYAVTNSGISVINGASYAYDKNTSRTRIEELCKNNKLMYWHFWFVLNNY